MTVNARTLTEILEGVANMRKVVDYVHNLQKMTNKRWREYSSPHCRMHVEDYMNNAFAYYWQLIMDCFDATGNEAKALQEATGSFKKIASDYAGRLFYECSEPLRYGYKSRREADDILSHFSMYVMQFVNVRYGEVMIPKWIDRKPLSPPEWPRSMRPS